MGKIGYHWCYIEDRTKYCPPGDEDKLVFSYGSVNKCKDEIIKFCKKYKSAFNDYNVIIFEITGLSDIVRYEDSCEGKPCYKEQFSWDENTK